MKKLVLYTVTAMMMITAGANAACYADYKAKRDNPLQLHYGVIKLSNQDCNGQQPGRIIAEKIARDGWTLLNVLGTFEDDGLDRRRGNAGQYFLRY